MIIGTKREMNLLHQRERKPTQTVWYNAMKKKGKTSAIVQICLLFTVVILVSFLGLFWLSSNHQQQDPSKLPSPSETRPQQHDDPLFLNNRTELLGNVEVRKKPVSGGNAEAKDDKIHFIHIPKCGGTTMTTLLRQIQCTADPDRNSDCCLNPGFCDWHAHRRCSTIMGCINHFPNRKFIYKPMKSIAVFREPISRLISAWFYRGHSPNLDFFQVRPEFKEIQTGKRPRVTFAEYLEMHEYQNIQTRMLGADSFPYRNVTVTEETFAKAVDALSHLFFAGLQEEFQLSSEALVRAMNMAERMPLPEIKKERDHNSGKVSQEKAQLKADESLMRRAREVNQFDLRLYDLAVQKFCTTLQAYPDLSAKVKEHGKVQCNHFQ